MDVKKNVNAKIMRNANVSEEIKGNKNIQNKEEVFTFKIKNENNSSNNIDDNNKIDNNNLKKPPLPKYNPNSSLFNSVSSYNTSSSDGQQEILKEGGEVNDEYKYKPRDIKNKNLKTLIKKGGSKENQQPLSESTICPVSDLSRQKINLDHYVNIKHGTQMNPILPKLQMMIPQNGKRKDNNINNDEKVNVSIHDSIRKSGNSLYIPKKDNGPILDIENIS